MVAFHTECRGYSLNDHASESVHSFAHSGKESRFLMMKKVSSNPLRKFAVSLIFLALAVFLLAFAQPVFIFDSQNTVQEVAITDAIFVATETIIEKPEKPKLPVFSQPIESEPARTEPVALTETDDVHVVELKKLEAISPKVIYQSHTKNVLNVIPKQSGHVKKQVPKSNISSLSLKEKPLYLLDGVELSHETIMQTINPCEIQRIDILKDNSAKSLYGERGKNGVVLIQTITSQTNNLPLP